MLHVMKETSELFKIKQVVMLHIVSFYLCIVICLQVEKVQGGLDHGADEGILWDRAVSEADLIKLTKEKTGGGIDGSVDFVGMATTSAKAVASINKV